MPDEELDSVDHVPEDLLPDQVSCWETTGPEDEPVEPLLTTYAVTQPFVSY